MMIIDAITPSFHISDAERQIRHFAIASLIELPATLADYAIIDAIADISFRDISPLINTYIDFRHFRCHCRHIITPQLSHYAISASQPAG
jgi:hypothetical protein